MSKALLAIHSSNIQIYVPRSFGVIQKLRFFTQTFGPKLFSEALSSSEI